MQPKPLTKERRADILDRVSRADGQARRAIYRDLLAAEAYWREAVKNVHESFFTVLDSPEEFCVFCGGELASQQVHHKPDCAWVLANES